jgi:hypothetical protein
MIISSPEQSRMYRFMQSLGKIDRRIISCIVLLSLIIPLLTKLTLPPAPMRTADAFFDSIQNLKTEDGKFVIVTIDYGPSTQAENGPQAEAALEHLFRKRIPFAIMTLTPYATPFLESVPKKILARLQTEQPNEKWAYGKDWINLGFQPGMSITIQALAKSEDMREYLKVDAHGTTLSKVPMFSTPKTIHSVQSVIHVTGLVGALNIWLQFFQAADYRPPILHGCTSITIPEAYIFFDSGQISGLLEGIAGAAWYEEKIQEVFPNRLRSDAMQINTTLAIAHLVVIGLIILGNISVIGTFFFKRNSLEKGLSKS